jgi:integrase
VDPGAARRFLDAAEQDQLYPLFHLIAHRGLRRGEACGVSWTDVDLDAARLTVRAQLVQVGWEVMEGAPKSDAGERTIALDAGTVAVLRTHRRRQLAARLAWGPAWADSGRVFTREDGSALHPATVTERFHALSVAAKLPPIRLHDLRHGAASLMLAAGVAPKVVQETLGHSTVGPTLDTYNSVYTEVATEAAEAAAALVPRGTGPAAHTPHTHRPSGASAWKTNRWSGGGAGGARTHDLTDYESAALTN